MQLILQVLYVIFFLLVFSVTLLTVYYYYKLFTTKYYLDKIRLVPQVPILGSVLHCRNTHDIHNVLMTYPTKYGRSSWAMIGLEPVLFTADPKLLELILSSAIHIDKPALYKIFHRVIGNGVGTSKGDTWRAQRKLLNPTFHFKVLEKFMPVFNKHSNEMIKKLGVMSAMVSTDIHETTKDWSLGQVTETVMGLKPDGTNADTTLYREAGKAFLQIAMERLLSPLECIDFIYYFCRNYWREVKVSKAMERHVHSIVDRKKKEYDDGLIHEARTVNEDGTKQKIISLDLLIQYQRSGAQLTEQDMSDHCQVILYAGYDTTATAVALTMYHLAKYPEVQEKLFEEAYRVLDGDINTDITIAHLQDMKYLDLVLKESLRMTPTLPLYARELNENLDYGGMTLPKGLTVAFSICGLHMDPEYFPEPEKFIPERFTPENCKKRPAYAYLPFSAGPRNCIGHRYAVLAAKVGLAKAVLNCKFFSVGHKLSLAVEGILASKTGVKVGIRRRDLPAY